MEVYLRSVITQCIQKTRRLLRDKQHTNLEGSQIFNPCFSLLVGWIWSSRDRCVKQTRNFHDQSQSSKAFFAFPGATQ